MGFKPALVALLVAVTQAELASIRYYDLVCPRIDGKVAEINPGHLVRYTCGILGYNNGDRIIAARPSDCAKLCQDTTGCTGSSWLADEGQCIMSGGLYSGPRRYTIHMQNVDSLGENAFRTRGLEVDADLGPGLGVGLDLGLGQEQGINLENSQGFGLGFGSGHENAQQHGKEYYEEGASQLNECNNQLRTEPHSPKGQLCKCQAERLTEKLDFAARLNQCQKRHSQLEQDSTKHINTCQEEHLKNQQACTTKLGQHVHDIVIKTEQLEQCREAADMGTAELGKYRDEATLKTTQLDQCQKDIDFGAAELTKCRNGASLTTDQLNQCRNNAATTTTQLSQCRAGNPTCPSNSGRTLRSNGRTFKLFCSRWHTMQGHFAESYTNSFEDCVTVCASNHSCKSMVYGQGNGRCLMSSESRSGNVTPGITGGTWHGAYPI